MVLCCLAGAVVVGLFYCFVVVVVLWSAMMLGWVVDRWVGLQARSYSSSKEAGEAGGDGGGEGGLHPVCMGWWENWIGEV